MGKVQWFATGKLKEFREQKGYTQKEMADLFSLEFGTAISTSLWQQWETGVQNLLPEQVLYLAKLLKTDYKELVEQK